jgi:hypothetical protein
MAFVRVRDMEVSIYQGTTPKAAMEAWTLLPLIMSVPDEDLAGTGPKLEELARESLEGC